MIGIYLKQQKRTKESAEAYPVETQKRRNCTTKTTYFVSFKIEISVEV